MQEKSPQLKRSCWKGQTEGLSHFIWGDFNTYVIWGGKEALKNKGWTLERRSSQTVVFSSTIAFTNNDSIHDGLNPRRLKSRQSLLRACWCARRRRTGAFNGPLPKCRGQVSSGVLGSGSRSFSSLWRLWKGACIGCVTRKVWQTF